MQEQDRVVRIRKKRQGYQQLYRTGILTLGFAWTGSLEVRAGPRRASESEKTCLESLCHVGCKNLCFGFPHISHVGWTLFTPQHSLLLSSNMDIGGSVREDEREEKKTGKKEERKRCEGERKNNFYKANKKKEIKS